MQGDSDTRPFGTEHLPEDAEALYAQGMAHYRQREWEEAKDYFVRLRVVAPDRRGVDALLSEVDIFIRLETMGPDQEGAAAAAAGTEEIQTVQESPAEESAAGWGRERRVVKPAVVGAVVLALIVLVFALGFDPGREDRVEWLLNQGRAAMNVGDYQRAVESFEEALALAPDREDIGMLHEKAEVYSRLDALCSEAESDAAAGRWNAASDKLEEILEAGDPTRCGARDKKDDLERRKGLEDRYSEAGDSFARGDWAAAISILAQLQVDAPAFRGAELEEMLFQAHMESGRELMGGAGDSLEVVGQAIQSFERALVIFPEGEVALEERELADLYRQGLLFLNQQSWLEAVRVLGTVYERRPDYLGGRAGSLLCGAHLQLGDVYYAARAWESAHEQYGNVRTVEGCGSEVKAEAALREAEVYRILYPPTLTPTRTPRPTATLVPTATATTTASAAATAVPPTGVPAKPTSRPATPTPDHS